MNTAPRRPRVVHPPEDRPVSSIEDERAFLAACFADAKVIDDFRSTVRVDTFFRDPHRTIYREMLRIRDGGQVPEALLVFDGLGVDPASDRPGRGGVTLADVEDLAHTQGLPANAASYAGKIAELAMYRRALLDAEEHLQRLRRPDEPIAEIISDYHARSLRTIAEEHGESTGMEALQLDARKASAYQIRPVKYLSKPGLPLGVPITLGGAAGEGKSTLLDKIIADLSMNRPTLGSSTPYGQAVDVLMLSCEDGREDALVPRLVAAGADLDRIEIIEGLKTPMGERIPFDITYVNYLRHHIERGNAAGRNYKLVTIDPITTYIGRAKIDDHRDAQLKPALEGLSSLTQDLEVTCVCLAHLNKGGTGKSASYRIMGGVAYVSSARLAYIYATDTEDPTRRILASPKANLPGGKPPALAVRIAPLKQDKALELLRPHTAHLDEVDRLELASQLFQVEFDGTVERTAEEVLDASLASGNRMEKARDFLMEMLDGGKFIPSTTIYAEGKKRGVSRSAIWEAKGQMDVTACKVTENGKTSWHWKMDNPDDDGF